MRRLVLVIAAAALLNGCAYYNGMYNANRLAGRATKAEREGRTLDANNYWNQVVVKADSVLARHGDSQWADDARLLRGRALARLGRCDAAIPELDRSRLELADSALAETAALELGRCRLTQRDLAAAVVPLTAVAASADPARRAEANALLAEVHIAAGEYGAALDRLAGLGGSRAVHARLVASAGSGRLDLGRAVADSLLAARDSMAPWGAFLTQLGRHDAAAPAAYIDALRERGAAPDSIGAWILADAERRLAAGDSGGVERLRDVEQVGRLVPAVGAAASRRAQIGVSRAATAEELGTAIEDVVRVLDQHPAYAAGLEPLARIGRYVVPLADTTTAATPQGDMLLFLAAELARDSLRAPALAAGLLRRVHDEWPASPYAPKAMLARVALQPGGGDPAPVLSEYPTSPYVLVALGGDAGEYRMLEDSLAAFAREWRTERRAPDAAPGVRNRPPRRAVPPSNGRRPGPGVARPTGRASALE